MLESIISSDEDEESSSVKRNQQNINKTGNRDSSVIKCN
jgi:hypothetical protein